MAKGISDLDLRTSPLVSVIVPHYNDLENLLVCLRSLSEQTLLAKEFEIVVADNNSASGIDVVRAACGDRAKVVLTARQGAAEARNAGVMASRGKYLAFIDSDCRPARDWLEHGIAALAHADMIGGRIDVAVESDYRVTPVEAFEQVFAFNNERYVNEEGFSVTANMFVSRAVFQKVRGFRAGFAEDKDWGQRAAGMGFRWAYAPELRVSHPARRGWTELRAKWRRLTREAYMTERQRPFGRLRWLLRAWAVLLSPFMHTIHILRSRKLERFGDRLNAIGILFRIRWWRFIEAHRILLAN